MKSEDPQEKEKPFALADGAPFVHPSRRMDPKDRPTWNVDEDVAEPSPPRRRKDRSDRPSWKDAGPSPPRRSSSQRSDSGFSSNAFTWHMYSHSSSSKRIVGSRLGSSCKSGTD